MNKQGNLSINSENLFPIIKKWLYSDHDIFYRELISNGCDAVTKLKKLEIMGEYQLEDNEKFKIQVVVNPDEKTLKFIDNGIGMTDEEVEEYITQIAFSGATDFLEKYKDKTNEDQIIGHFGLGFYSAFMVADKVTIDTLSWQKDAKPVHWECDGDSEYSISEGTRTERGTEITLYLNEESLEFANEYKAREVIEKYCSFMPVEIYLSKEGNEPEYETIDEDEVKPEDTVVEHIVEPAKTEEREKEDGTKETVEVTPERKRAKILQRPQLMNDIHPLWTKHPNDCTEEEYKEFYRKVFMDYKEPLFWIHLNMDYPFNLKGILYFPKINYEYESIEGKIKLYNNQVFIADNIKEVIPEFLMLLKGVIDCPDLPLNVSRSALQNDGFVRKISDYITKKVADRLSGMFKTDRENYEKYWDDINPFIKFGCIKDQKFNEKMKDYIIYKNLEGKYITLDEYLEAAKEKHENQVFYVTDEEQQSQYINMFKKEGLDALILKHNIDQPFISSLEQAKEGVKFRRIDTDLADVFKEAPSEEETKALEEDGNKLTDIFKKALSRETLTVKVEKLKNPDVSSMITLSEDSRRMQDMMKMYGMGDTSMFGGEGETLVLNANNDLVQYILANPDGEHTDLICQQLYDLALLAHKPLPADALTKFVERSNKIMKLLAK
ncbi:molecular chaperone HtpG [Catenibacillus scindens]|uniref:Molecular chaperone HtpG n=1 Tax=Catenibacillus scindens TaxID=673271 RepID=A0A7W8H842_9FIRM|nr:molecular chaperone HtpG [Catenibacillus scindens]MBB5262917.1 molecular chaperone HtpG [Catenibacillus scindens]